MGFGVLRIVGIFEQEFIDLSVLFLRFQIILQLVQFVCTFHLVEKYVLLLFFKCQTRFAGYILEEVRIERQAFALNVTNL